jgi:hypothetical protein
MLQNSNWEKGARSANWGTGGEGVSGKQGVLALLACLQMHKMLEETRNWFSLSCKPRVLCSHINKWFAVYTVHSLM